MSFTATRPRSATWAFWIGKTATSSPDTFGEAPGPLPKKPEELLSYVCDELCRHHLPEMTQEQLDAVCARCSLERLADEADEAELRIRTKAHRELNGLIADLRTPGRRGGRTA